MIRREECKVGDIILFGRPNGEKTRGKILKLNPSKAKVECLESRGSAHQAGGIWNVPYSMLHSINLDPNEISTFQDSPAKQPLVYRLMDENNPIIEIIGGIYAQLSPENLTCDGELPQYAVRKRAGELRRKLGFLQKAVGREISEGDYIEWDKQRREREAAMAVRK